MRRFLVKTSIHADPKVVLADNVEFAPNGLTVFTRRKKTGSEVWPGDRWSKEVVVHHWSTTPFVVVALAPSRAAEIREVDPDHEIDGGQTRGLYYCMGCLKPIQRKPGEILWKHMDSEISHLFL